MPLTVYDRLSHPQGLRAAAQEREEAQRKASVSTDNDKTETIKPVDPLNR